MTSCLFFSSLHFYFRISLHLFNLWDLGFANKIFQFDKGLAIKAIELLQTRALTSEEKEIDDVDDICKLVLKEVQNVGMYGITWNMFKSDVFYRGMFSALLPFTPFIDAYFQTIGGIPILDAFAIDSLQWYEKEKATRPEFEILINENKEQECVRRLMFDKIPIDLQIERYEKEVNILDGLIAMIEKNENIFIDIRTKLEYVQYLEKEKAKLNQGLGALDVKVACLRRKLGKIDIDLVMNVADKLNADLMQLALNDLVKKARDSRARIKKSSKLAIERIKQTGLKRTALPAKYNGQAEAGSESISIDSIEQKTMTQAAEMLQCWKEQLDIAGQKQIQEMEKFKEEQTKDRLAFEKDVLSSISKFQNEKELKLKEQLREEKSKCNFKSAFLLIEAKYESLVNEEYELELSDATKENVEIIKQNKQSLLSDVAKAIELSKVLSAKSQRVLIAKISGLQAIEADLKNTKVNSSLVST